jgi:SAM-dependent methyltransferase
MKFNSFEQYCEVYENLPIQGHISDDGIAHINPAHRFVGNFISENDINSVLDVGCGDGTFCFYIKSLKDIPVCGIDIQKKAILKCLINNERYDTDIQFVYTSFEEFDLNVRFDLVVSMEVIEHVYDVNRFKDMLNKYSNKYIALTTPDRLGNGGISGASEYHINNFSSDELKDFVGIDNVIMFDKFIGEDLGVIYRKRI